MKASLIDHSMLYDRDYQIWLDTTIKQLRQKNYEGVDWDNLLEELESLGKREKREVISRFTLILTHLLKWSYQPLARPYYGNSWISTIDEQRNQLELIFQDSPSLKNYLLDRFNDCYLVACKSAAKQTGLEINTFPVQSPFSFEDVLNCDYLPE